MLFYVTLTCSCILFLIITEKYRSLAFYFTLAIAISFPFIADTSDWDWFYFVKTFSVIIPIIILSIAQSKFYYNWKWVEGFHPFIPNIARFFLVLNIAEGVLLLFSLNQYSTALLSLILIFTIPKFSFNENQNLGFDNVLWISGYSYCFILGLMFFPKETNFFFPILMAVIIPIIFSLILKDWNVWLTFRIYSIYFILILDVIFSQNNFFVYELVNNSFFYPENRINVIVEIGFNIISSLIILTIIWQFVKKYWLSKNHSSVAYNGG